MAKDIWDESIATIWADDSLSDEARILMIDTLAATRPPGDARGMFERAGARDAAGQEHAAIPLYKAAISAGLAEHERVQAVIQLASSYRNVGGEKQAVELLEREQANPYGSLRSETDVFLALSYYSAGQPGKALALLMRTIAPTLEFYQRSVLAYADELDATQAMPTANTGETAL